MLHIVVASACGVPECGMSLAVAPLTGMPDTTVSLIGVWVLWKRQHLADGGFEPAFVQYLICEFRHDGVRSQLLHVDGLDRAQERHVLCDDFHHSRCERKRKGQADLRGLLLAGIGTI